MDKLMVVGLWICGIFVAIVFAAFIYAIGHSIQQSATNRFWISVGDTTYYTDAYEQKGDCIYFQDYYGKQSSCGFYTITDKGQ